MADGLFTFGSDQTAQVANPGMSVAAQGYGAGFTNDASAKAPLGSLYRENGRVWRYVQFDNGQGDVAAVNNAVVVWKTLAPASGTFVVTTDYTDAIGKNLCAGVLHGIVTDQYYTWIQVGGITTALLDFSSLSGDPVAASVAGCKCIYYAGDKKFSLIDVGTNPAAVVYGVLLAAANYTAGTGTVLLQNLEW